MRAAWLVAPLLLVAMLGQAATMRVGVDDSVRALHAMRHDVVAQLDVAATALDRAGAARPATPMGTSEAPAELSEGGTPMGTAVVAGHWTYEVTLREREAAGVASGVFEVQLLVGGQAVGALFAQQAVSNPGLREAVRATFDIGAAPPDGALLVVRVVALAPDALSHELTSAMRAGAPPSYVWEGEGADNPTLAGRAGQAATITIINGDGTVPHNLVVLQDGAVQARTDGDATARGESRQLSWTPAEPGSYRYECEYHPSMAGTIEVTQ